jgi:hypothetical protein
LCTVLGDIPAASRPVIHSCACIQRTVTIRRRPERLKFN